MSKKTPKFEALVVNAIRQLQALQGSTANEIANYLGKEYDFTGPQVKRQIQLAIKRAVNYGILYKSKRGYVTCDRNIPESMVDSDMNDCGSCNRNRGRSSAKQSRKSAKGHSRKRSGHSKAGRGSRRSGGCGGGGGKMRGARRGPRPGKKHSLQANEKLL